MEGLEGLNLPDRLPVVLGRATLQCTSLALVSRYGSETNTYAITERTKRGNRLLANAEAERRVTFDLKTRAKISDMEERSFRFLLRLYQYDRKSTE